MKSLTKRVFGVPDWDEAEETRIIASLQRTSGLIFPTSRLPIIERGEFASLVRRLLAASKEQCQRLEY